MLSEIFEKILNEIKKASDNFNKRDVGLDLKTFLVVFSVVLCDMKNITLEGLANKCIELQKGLKMTKQSLHKRLEAGSEELKKVLEKTINICIENKSDSPQTTVVFELFKSVLITDSTTLSLPDKLEKEHKGLGGTNSRSALKLQATYDVKTKSFRKTDIIKDAKTNDAKYMETLIDEVKANELLIFDLGYYGIVSFEKLKDKGAYFISKVKTNTKFYECEDNNKEILFKDLVKNKSSIDVDVFISGNSNKKIEVRLVGIKLPENVYNEKIRKARKATKGTLSAETLERLKWIILITNVERDILDVKTLCELYRIRWQIELIFKTWKSYFCLQKMNNIGKHYLDCLIYGKLIMITLMNCLFSHMFYYIYKLENRELSYMRFMKNICEELDKFVWFFINEINFTTLLERIMQVIKSSLIEKRKRKTTEQAISNFDLPEDVLRMLT